MKRGTWWPIGVTIALTAVVAANIAIAFVAGGDPSFAIEPNYYAKAVAWDSTLEQDRRNVALGWSIAPSLSPYESDRGATLRVQLTDSSGRRLAGATVEVAALFNARAGDVHTATLHPDSIGGYAGELPVRHAGVWELRFTVVRGGDRFTRSTRVEATRGETP